MINTLEKIWKFIDNLERTSICQYSLVISTVLSNGIRFNQVVDNYRTKGLMRLSQGLQKDKEKIWNMKMNEIPFHNFLPTYLIHLKENQVHTTDHTTSCSVYSTQPILRFSFEVEIPQNNDSMIGEITL